MRPQAEDAFDVQAPSAQRLDLDRRNAPRQRSHIQWKLEAVLPRIRSASRSNIQIRAASARTSRGTALRPEPTTAGPLSRSVPGRLLRPFSRAASWESESAPDVRYGSADGARIAVRYGSITQRWLPRQSLQSGPSADHQGAIRGGVRPRRDPLSVHVGRALGRAVSVTASTRIASGENPRIIRSVRAPLDLLTVDVRGLASGGCQSSKMDWISQL